MTTTRALHLLVGRALVSERFCTDLLYSRRAELIQDIGLRPDETEQVLAAPADTLTDFAKTLDQIIRSREASF